MPLELAECDASDMNSAFAVVSEAFGSEHPYIEYVFPEHSTPTGRRNGGERFRAIMESDPNTTYLKVTESDTKSIVGVAKWNIYNGIIPDRVRLQGDYWTSQYDLDLAQEIFDGYLEPRMQAIQDSEGHIVSLDMMTVLPEYQRKGVGGMLLRWGVEKADEMGVKTVVEATKQGKGLYLKEGFEVKIELYTVQLPARFADKDTQSFTWMIRSDAKNKA